jgi:sugar porter (SP) family MFS transporter
VARYTASIALIVSLGGFLMGFDASVISGVVGSIELEFQLSRIELGWSVSSLALTATLGMLVSGPLSDRIGRRPVLRLAAVVFAVSAIASALATSFWFFVAARMLGGLGVGAALIVAPMYIAEMAPAEQRGRLVSFNQLNIVIGISTAFFSNYFLLGLSEPGGPIGELSGMAGQGWRWMLGVEMLPAVLYFLALFLVPESPRWLVMKGQDEAALRVLDRVDGAERAAAEIADIRASLSSPVDRGSLRELFGPSLRLALTLGISIGILQQITGINSVFFYAPMIFEQSGIGTNAAFMQAVLVGLVNVVFTVVAIALIDRLGRRPLLGFGLTGIAACMLILAWGFSTATYTVDQATIAVLPASIGGEPLAALEGSRFTSDTAFREALYAVVGPDVYRQYEAQLVGSAISINSTLILVAILGFVASFAFSLGPIMWVLFSELFPNRVRGVAVSFVGFINSTVAFLVTFVFPWQLEKLGNAATFTIYGLFAVFGLAFVMRLLPETNGQSLEELEDVLSRRA